MLMAGWIKITKTNLPPENISILIAFKEFGRPLNKYRAREAVRRGMLYYQPEYNAVKSNEFFYQPQYYMPMPYCK